MIPLQTTTVAEFSTESGVELMDIPISFVDSDPEGNKPVIMVVHALTGNAYSFGENGWWASLIGPNKTLDLDTYRVISFNIPGNGFHERKVQAHDLLIPRDVARLFNACRMLLGIKEVHALIGGSLGGGIIWEWALLLGSKLKFLIPIAASWESSDWVMGQTHVQHQILEKAGMETARMAAMTIYRNPASLKQKFDRSVDPSKGVPNIESWLTYHGDKLASRYTAHAYKTMNFLLGRLDIFKHRFVSDVRNSLGCHVVQIGINSDLLFSPKEMMDIHFELTKWGISNHFYLIDSPHGHDAFLIEFEQLNRILKPYFPKRERRAHIENRKELKTCVL